MTRSRRWFALLGTLATLLLVLGPGADRAEAETEALLRNILPDDIVERLRLRPEEPIADAFAETSILFSDIQGFVPLSRSLGPERTVEMLNEMMRRFDALADEQFLPEERLSLPDAIARLDMVHFEAWDLELVEQVMTGILDYPARRTKLLKIDWAELARVAQTRENVMPATIALATAYQESDLENIDHGDRDSVGLFQHDDKPQRVEMPAVASAADMLKDYKPKAALAAAEAFDPSPDNIDSRTKKLDIDGIKVSLLQKKTRGEDHPYTIAAMGNLATSLQELGRTDEAGIAALAPLLHAARPSEVHFVMPATMKTDDALATLAAFGPLWVTRVTFTKLDEASTYGSMLGVAAESALPVSYVTAGREVPDDIHPATAAELARRVKEAARRRDRRLPGLRAGHRRGEGRAGRRDEGRGDAHPRRLRLRRDLPAVRHRQHQVGRGRRHVRGGDRGRDGHR